MLEMTAFLPYLPDRINPTCRGRRLLPYMLKEGTLEGVGGMAEYPDEFLDV
jgi:hypothetical protein